MKSLINGILSYKIEREGFILEFQFVQEKDSSLTTISRLLKKEDSTVIRFPSKSDFEDDPESIENEYNIDYIIRKSDIKIPKDIAKVILRLENAAYILWDVDEII